MNAHHQDMRESQTALNTNPNSLYFISETATTNDFPASQEIVEFDSKMTLGKALHGLAHHKILSAPVFDKETNKYLGFVDIFDFLSLAVGLEVLMNLLPEHMITKKPKTSADLEFESELSLKDFFQGGESPFNAWYPVQQGEKMRVVVDLLAKKARRVPVLNAKGKVMQIISQSAISQMLFSNPQMQTLLQKETLRQSGFGLKPVVTAKISAPARDAFQAMVSNGVSSVCIVDDETGQVITALSTKDIRLLPRLESVLLAKDNLFDLSCQEFVSLIRQGDFPNSHAACVVVGLNDSLMTVLGKLSATKMHRVYIIDEERKPVGVVSVSDVVVALQALQPPMKKE